MFGKMAQNCRPLKTDLVNIRAEVGDTQREKRERNQRVAEQEARLQQVMEMSRQRNPSTGTYVLDLKDHGAPKDFDIVKSRQMQRRLRGLENNQVAVQERGTIPMTRAKWQEEQFEKHFVNVTDEQRYANARYARREERAVIGTNFVPDSIDDLPECERQAVIQSRQNSNDRLWYEIRNTDIMRDGWRLFVKERAGEILAPPYGRPGPC